MASEARRGLSRIVANYARLFTAIVCSIILIPLLGHWLGDDALGLYLFIVAQVGIAAMFQDVMRHSMVRELGAAWHAERTAFAAAYNAAFYVCAVVAVMTVAAYGILLLLVPVLKIPELYVVPARWMIVCEAVYTCLLVLLAPPFNMYVVTERFVAHNLFTAATRASYLASAATLAFGFKITDVQTALVLFIVLAVALKCLFLLVAVARLVVIEPALRPRPSLATRQAARDVAGTFGWNSGVIVAANMHDRVGMFIMNGFFGLFGNTVFGIAIRVVSYIRMATLGMTFGLDAVSARLSSTAGREHLASMLRHTTRLHALVAIPGALAIFILAEPLLRLWLGRALDDAGRAIPIAVVLVRIMALGLAARSIADGWIKLLYGAGHVRRYAPLVLAGGLVNPVIAIGLILTLPDQGGDTPLWRTSITGAAWGVVGAVVVFHLGLLPIVGARLLHVRTRDMLAPLVRPVILAAVCCPFLLVPHLWPERFLSGGAWSLLEVAIAGALFGGTYLLLAIGFMLSGEERRWIFGAARRRLVKTES